MRDVAEWMEVRRAQINGWIGADLDRPEPLGGRIIEAMRYSATAGGKRLRPLLVLAGGEYIGVGADRLRPAALAVEYLHTYSLIHDDLPAMDNDDWRRGRPTNHKVFGEALAILAGDALLTESFAQFAALGAEGFDARHVLEAFGRFCAAAGPAGLIAGQTADLQAEHQRIGLTELEALHAKKTGALFQAACQIAAWLTGDEVEAARLERFGWHFGLAFQIVDDILNVVGDAGVMGKATGTDASLGKATYPGLVGIDASWQLARRHQQAAGEALGGRDSARYLRGLLAAAVDRQA